MRPMRRASPDAVRGQHSPAMAANSVAQRTAASRRRFRRYALSLHRLSSQAARLELRPPPGLACVWQQPPAVHDVEHLDVWPFGPHAAPMDAPGLRPLPAMPLQRSCERLRLPPPTLSADALPQAPHSASPSSSSSRPPAAPSLGGLARDEVATAAELAATEGAETEAKEETREEANEETEDETKEEAREEEIDDHKSDSEVQVQFTATVKDKEVNTATDDPCRPLRAGRSPPASSRCSSRPTSWYGLYTHSERRCGEALLRVRGGS